MSTYLYLECLDHDPPLQAEDESGQHLYDLRRIRAEIAHRDELVAAHPDGVPMVSGFDDIDGYFQSNSVRFLAAHPKCRIGIRDDYGHEHPTIEPGQGNGDTETCPTPCHDDCEDDCHEWHNVPWKRQHDPQSCPVRPAAEAKPIAPKVGDRVTAENVGSIGTVRKVYGEMAPYLLANHAEVAWDDGSTSHEPINELTVQSGPAAEAKAPDSAKPEAPSSGGNSSGSLPAVSADQPATRPDYPATEAKGQDGGGES